MLGELRLAIRAALAASLVLPALHASAQDLEAGKAHAQACIACHGADGNSVSAEIPSLAGQTWRYVYNQLKDYKEGRRSNPVMTPMASSLSRDDMINVANWFAGQSLKPPDKVESDASIAQGKAKADAALCSMCHLGAFQGQNEMPRLAGQHTVYLAAQLKAFRARERTNDAGNMTAVTQGLSDADIQNIAGYLNSIR